MFEHIIVPFDGTEPAQRAVMVGADLAGMLHADMVVTTANVVEDENAVANLKAHAMAMSDDRATVWVEAHSSASGAIATVASYRPNSLICMSSHARNGILRTVYGSLAEKLLHDLDAPVLMLGPSWRGDSVINLRHLIVCFDGSPTSEAAIPLAGMFAAALPVNITMLHVRERADDPVVDLARFATPLQPLCDVVDLVELTDTDFVSGAVDVIEHSIEPIIVMATHSRGGLDRLVRGSATAELAKVCPVPMLVQRGPLATSVPRPSVS